MCVVYIQCAVYIQYAVYIQCPVYRQCSVKVCYLSFIVIEHDQLSAGVPPWLGALPAGGLLGARGEAGGGGSGQGGAGA